MVTLTKCSLTIWLRNCASRDVAILPLN